MTPLSKALTISFLPALLLAFPATPGLAVPLTLKTGRCLCFCTASGNLEIYEGKGYDCSTFVGKTCNATDSKTGGVTSGRLTSCDPEVTQQDLKKDVPTLQPEGPFKKRSPKGNIQQQ
jgi:hypothetical protein